jgi:hypothetical protein
MCLIDIKKFDALTYFFMFQDVMVCESDVVVYVERRIAEAICFLDLPCNLKSAKTGYFALWNTKLQFLRYIIVQSLNRYNVKITNAIIDRVYNRIRCTPICLEFMFGAGIAI